MLVPSEDGDACTCNCKKLVADWKLSSEDYVVILFDRIIIIADRGGFLHL